MKDRKLHILKAAQQVFGDNGFHGTKIQDIADAAGIGKGTVYEYFSSKEDLFYSMIRHSLSLYMQRIREGMGEGSCIERLLTLVRINRQVVGNSAPFMDMFLSSGAFGENIQFRQQILDLFFSLKEDMIALIADTLALGQAEGTINRDTDLAFIAEVFLHMVMGFCQRGLRTGQKQDENALLGLFLQGVGSR